MNHEQTHHKNNGKKKFSEIHSFYSNSMVYNRLLTRLPRYYVQSSLWAPLTLDLYLSVLIFLFQVSILQHLYQEQAVRYKLVTLIL